MTEPREALAALLHEPDIDGICEDDQVGDPRTCERLADRLLAAGVHLGDEGLDVERLARAMARLAEVGPPAHIDIALAEEHWSSYVTEATDLAAEYARLTEGDSR